MQKPLIPENKKDSNDMRNIYNPGKHEHTLGMYAQVKNQTAVAQANHTLSQVWPAHPTGLEPAPKDQQYDVPLQMRKPLIPENKHDTNDLRNVYNPDKYQPQNNVGMYAQAEKNASKSTIALKKVEATSSSSKTAVKTEDKAKKEAKPLASASNTTKSEAKKEAKPEAKKEV